MLVVIVKKLILVEFALSLVRVEQKFPRVAIFEIESRALRALSSLFLFYNTPNSQHYTIVVINFLQRTEHT